MRHHFARSAVLTYSHELGEGIVRRVGLTGAHATFHSSEQFPVCALLAVTALNYRCNLLYLSPTLSLEAASPYAAFRYERVQTQSAGS